MRKQRARPPVKRAERMAAAASVQKGTITATQAAKMDN